MGLSTALGVVRGRGVVHGESVKGLFVTESTHSSNNVYVLCENNVTQLFLHIGQK